MPIPFGFSVGDILLVASLLKSCYQSCKEAGGAYREISHLAWSLDSVLATISAEMQHPSSPLAFYPDRITDGKRQLAESIRGCEAIIDEVLAILDNYGSLDPKRESSRVRKVWDRARYVAAQVDQKLHEIRSRLTVGITTIMLQLDVLHIASTARMQSTLDVTRREIRQGFAGTRTAIWSVAERLRVGELRAAEEEEEVGDGRYEREWEEVKRELRALGFGNREVKRSKRVLMSYIREQALSVSGDSGNIGPNSGSRSRSRESLRSRGRRRVRTRARRNLSRRSRTGEPRANVTSAATLIPRSPPPPYERGSRWSDTSSTIIASPSRSQSRRYPHGPYARSRTSLHEREHGRSGLGTGELILLGIAIASVSYIALDHYQQKKKREKSRRR